LDVEPHQLAQAEQRQGLEANGDQEDELLALIHDHARPLAGDACVAQRVEQSQDARTPSCPVDLEVQLPSDLVPIGDNKDQVGIVHACKKLRVRTSAAMSGDLQLDSRSPRLGSVVDGTACSWQPGKVRGHIEKLMFGDSPQQEEGLASLIVDEILETPDEDPAVHGQDTQIQEGFSGVEALLSTDPHSASSAAPLAVWFKERLRGDGSSWVRPTHQDECALNEAFSKALAQRKRYRGGAIDSVYVPFCRELKLPSTNGLRCIPLDGDTARRVPVELTCENVSALRLPSMQRMRRTTSWFRVATSKRHCGGAASCQWSHRLQNWHHL